MKEEVITTNTNKYNFDLEISCHKNLIKLFVKFEKEDSWDCINSWILNEENFYKAYKVAKEILLEGEIC